MKVSASCSMGREAYLHDVRLSHTDNVSMELSKDNVVLIDELQKIPQRDEQGKRLSIQQRIEHYINSKLDPFIEQYNQKQKRKDRKIKEEHYTDWHNNQGNKKGGYVYEFVMQYGEHNDLGKKYYEANTMEEKQAMKDEFTKTYAKWLDDWKKAHPQMKILWATCHFDEKKGTPHCHFCVVPFGVFKRGIAIQVSMSKCLENEGYERTDTKKDGFQLARVFQDFRNIQEADLIRLGYEIKERGASRPHLSKENYIAEQQYKELCEAKDSLTFEVNELKMKKKSQLNQIQDLHSQSTKGIVERNALGKIKSEKDHFGEEYVKVHRSTYDSIREFQSNFNKTIEAMMSIDYSSHENLREAERLRLEQQQIIDREVARRMKEYVDKTKEERKSLQQQREMIRQEIMREARKMVFELETDRNVNFFEYIRNNYPSAIIEYDKFLRGEAEPIRSHSR